MARMEAFLTARLPQRQMQILDEFRVIYGKTSRAEVVRAMIDQVAIDRALHDPQEATYETTKRSA